MIPKGFIAQWRTTAPWDTDAKIEQDLIISRAIVEIFSHPLLASNLAFRGGTALHKLFLAPAARYSEDIDLVQMNAGPIGPVFDALHEKLNSWLGVPSRKLGTDIVIFTYRVQSEGYPQSTLKLKIEINTREHFSVLGLQKREFSVDSRWFSGNCKVPTFGIEELLATKLRALYQRRKGRDLFDLWLGFTKTDTSAELITKCFDEYMRKSKLKVSAKEYEANLEEKLKHPEFIKDTADLLRNDILYSIDDAYQLFLQKILPVL